MLEKLFRSNAEVGVLSIVLFEENLHLREISRRAEASPCETKRELDNLVSLGILTLERKGNLSLYQTNPACPFLSELKSLYLKTDGAFSLLRKEFQKLPGIKYALVYGSMAKGTYSEKSDIDLLVVGSIAEPLLESLALRLQKILKREINYILWSERDYLSKIKEKGSFISSLLSSPKIMLVGDEDGFGKA